MRVLIVEDEPAIALEIESIVLGRVPGAETVIAFSVQRALAAIDDGMGMAFLDVDVTDGKTYPLALELRLRNIPFVFVSGARSEDAPHGLSEATFIAKPFTAHEIVRSVDEMNADRPNQTSPEAKG
ncbi:MAG: response regulator [Hansschlegelia sp.]